MYLHKPSWDSDFDYVLTVGGMRNIIALHVVKLSSGRSQLW